MSLVQLRKYKGGMMGAQDSNVKTKEMRGYDIVVHIGAPKTGSSALQFFLKNNKTLLENYGYCYPDHGVDNNNISGGHSKFADLLYQIAVELGRKNKGDSEKYISEASAVLHDYLKEAQSKGLTLLLSAERMYFYGRIFQPLVTDYSVRVIAFFRDPLESILSVHNQLVKRNLLTQSLDEYCDSLIKQPQLQNQYKGSYLFDWKVCFGEDNVNVYPYDRELFQKDRIEHVFLRSLGITSEEWGEFSYSERPVNLSYTESAKELMRQLNGVLDPEKKGMNLRVDSCLQAFSDKYPEPRRSVHEMFSRPMLERMKEAFYESNTAIVNLVSGARDGWLMGGEDDSKVDVNLGSHLQQYSLKDVASVAFKGDPQALFYVKQCISDSMVTHAGNSALIVLADAFGVPTKPSPQ